MFARWVFWFGGSSLLGLSLLGKNFPTICGLSQIRWCAESLFGIFPTSIFGLDKIRWFEKACLALALHPVPVSAKCDGVKKACLALALHPLSVSTNSDGVPDKKRSEKFVPSLFSLGRIRWFTFQKCSNNLHPSMLSIKSDEEQAL